MSQACFGDFSVFSKMIHSTNPNTKSEKKRIFKKNCEFMYDNFLKHQGN